LKIKGCGIALWHAQLLEKAQKIAKVNHEGRMPALKLAHNLRAVTRVIIPLIKN